MTGSDVDRTDEWSQGAAYVEGRFVPVAEARVPVLDWGFLRSDATYDVVHVWQGSFFRLDDHLDRFWRGIERLQLTPPVGRDGIAAVLAECVRRAGLRDAYVEMICTRGLPAVAGARDPRRSVNAFYAFALPFQWLADAGQRERGLHLVVSRIRRIPPDSVDPTVKNYHWLDLVGGLFEAFDRGGETTVLTDERENVVEGPGFNLFVVAGGRLATPDRGVLEGMTRRTALEIAEAFGLPCDLRPVPADELRAADEAFVTSTAGGIVPVTRVDGVAVGDGALGPITARIHDEYWRLHADPRHATPVQYAAASASG